MNVALPAFLQDRVWPSVLDPSLLHGFWGGETHELLQRRSGERAQAL